LKKKDKQMMKHELFLQRLDASRAPYSKSHARRIKRKEKEEIAGGLGAIKAALSSMEGVDVPLHSAAAPSGNQGSSAKASAIAQRRPGQIGEGKGAPLTKAQRKQALKAERLRQPLILSNPDFAANPFKTIRLHAQNTLIPHERSA
ncbi:uncharacterized protein STEHIDRAFT_63376, partial [Stereum hirsutum FP-91666 SS1]|uniref:uncharacterized protein n=1 Tax=Stereum hirsutum (strain FP-91666) TaxID=721885 RepID=UPI0004449F90